VLSASTVRLGDKTYADRQSSVPDVPTLGQTALAVTGILLVAGGGYIAVNGANGTGTCGASTLYASPVDEADADSDANRVGLAELTADQRDLAERAIDGERPAVDAEQWPWFETALLVEYQGDYYRFYTVTTECPFSPVLVLGLGVLVAGIGVAALALAGRGLLPSFGTSLER
jgi:hypothetical protein